MPFVLELYSDSDVESDVSSEEIVEDQHHYRKRRFGRLPNRKEKSQSFDSESEVSREFVINITFYNLLLLFCHFKK